ncbi:MAG: hypothetical protein ACYS47_06650 [Planctomycetota bacterium]|jgi:hypothetical protein
MPVGMLIEHFVLGVVWLCVIALVLLGIGYNEPVDLVLHACRGDLFGLCGVVLLAATILMGIFGYRLGRYFFRRPERMIKALLLLSHNNFLRSIDKISTDGDAPPGQDPSTKHIQIREPEKTKAEGRSFLDKIFLWLFSDYMKQVEPRADYVSTDESSTMEEENVDTFFSCESLMDSLLVARETILTSRPWLSDCLDSSWIRQLRNDLSQAETRDQQLRHLNDSGRRLRWASEVFTFLRDSVGTHSAFLSQTLQSDRQALRIMRGLIAPLFLSMIGSVLFIFDFADAYPRITLDMRILFSVATLLGTLAVFRTWKTLAWAYHQTIAQHFLDIVVPNIVAEKARRDAAVEEPAAEEKAKSRKTKKAAKKSAKKKGKKKGA